MKSKLYFANTHVFLYFPSVFFSNVSDDLFRRVFTKLNFVLAEDVINDLVMGKPGMIEKVLLMLQVKIKRAEYARGRLNDKPEADQHQSMYLT